MELLQGRIPRRLSAGRDGAGPARGAAQGGPDARHAALLAAAFAATDAHAQSTAAVVGLSLALVACAGGALFGAIAGWKPPATLRFPTAFLIYLGLLTVAASTRAGSLEIVPLAIVLGAIAGVVPFAACFFAVRALVARLRAGRRG